MNGIPKYGDGEKISALTLIQNVMKTIADTKMVVKITKATEFSSFTAIVDALAVNCRFKNFTAVLNRVRYHKMFEMKDAVKKRVVVIAPNVFLVKEVIAFIAMKDPGCSHNPDCFC